MNEEKVNLWEAIRLFFVRLLVLLGVIEKEFSLEEKVKNKLQKLKKAKNEYKNMEAHFIRKKHGIKTKVKKCEDRINHLQKMLEDDDVNEEKGINKLKNKKRKYDKFEKRKNLVQKQLDNVKDKIDEVDEQIVELEIKLEEFQLKQKNLDLEKESNEFSSDFSKEKLEHEIEKTDSLIDTYEEMNMDESEKIDKEIEEALNESDKNK